MRDSSLTVSFELGDLSFVNVQKFVARNYRPAWQRRWDECNWFLISFSILAGFSSIKWTVEDNIPFIIFGLGLFGMICVSQVAKRKNLKNYVQSSLRSGNRTISLDDSGLGCTSLYGQQLLPYNVFLDVVETSGDVIFVISQFEYVAIPSSAFTSDEGRTRFVDAARLHLLAAKEKTT